VTHFVALCVTKERERFGTLQAQKETHPALRNYYNWLKWKGEE